MSEKILESEWPQWLLKEWNPLRNAGTPFAIIRCADYDSVIGTVNKAYTGRTVEVNGEEYQVGVLQWDVMRGVVGSNDTGEETADKINTSKDGEPASSLTSAPVKALDRIKEFVVPGSIIFMLNLHIVLEAIETSLRLQAIQGISNLRSQFEKSGCTLVILCPDIKVPTELTNDVVEIVVPLPDKKGLEKVVAAISDSIDQPAPEGPAMDRCTDALLGISEWAAKQICAMTIRKSGYDETAMWRMKIADVNRVPGLRAVRERESSFDNLLGWDNAVEFARALLAGREAPALIVLLDEMEKQLGGQNDSSGVNQDAIGQLLTSMEENRWDGMIMPGFPGCGKTEYAKCLGAKSGLFVWMDMGGMKGSYVGQSEKMFRAAMAKLKAIGGERVFFVGTCNSTANIPGPLWRRMTAGAYMADFPSNEARERMWKQYIKIYGLPDQATPELANVDHWTGAEIKKCAMWAYRLGVSLEAFAPRITPAYRVMGEEVEALRRQASGKYLRVDAPGVYTYKPAKKVLAPQARSMSKDN